MWAFNLKQIFERHSPEMFLTMNCYALLLINPCKISMLAQVLAGAMLGWFVHGWIHLTNTWFLFNISIHLEERQESSVGAESQTLRSHSTSRTDPPYLSVCVWQAGRRKEFIRVWTIKQSLVPRKSLLRRCKPLLRRTATEHH